MIELVLSSLPIDEVPGNIAVATFFQDIRPLQGSTGLIDWRLNGRVSELLLQGRITGEFSEALIMPAQGRIGTRDIFMFGLGNSGEMNEKKFEQGCFKLVEKITRLKLPEVVVSFGDLAKDFMSWRAILRSFMNTLSATHYDMQVVCAEDSKWISEAKKRNMDFGPEVHVSYA